MDRRTKQADLDVLEALRHSLGNAGYCNDALRSPCIQMQSARSRKLAISSVLVT